MASELLAFANDLEKLAELMARSGQQMNGGPREATLEQATVVSHLLLERYKEAQENAKVAARAAIRVGIIDCLLQAVKEGDIELAGIFQQQLKGERKHRLAELQSVGVKWSDIQEMGFNNQKVVKK